MGFAGNLRTLSLPEVVQTLARIQATGILRLAADEGHRDVVFNVGAIIGVEFTSGAERQALLQRMIMQGKLDATAAAAISAAGSETQVVRGLVEQGLVTEEEVSEARQTQAEEELISLCTWETADFVFHDAGPEEQEATELVEKWSKLELKINSGSLLMEAARRMDEWTRLKEKIPDSAIVFGVANGQDEGLAKASEEYPAMAVVPLVDAIRNIEDIVKDAVVTRLEVYQVLAGLLDQKLICQLSREDLLAHADFWKEQHNNQLAARLYRRSLSIFPIDNETQIKLGACLEYIGDQDEAAQCYGQLARGFADEGDPGRASEFARHAVSLRTEDPKLRQILARCHFARGDTVAAASELKEIARIYLDLGQLEDARGTCLKILEINKGDEYARRELARIFSRVEKDNQSEDVVVCVQCGTVNHREAHTCTGCKASLQLTCLSCSRVVAVSDRLCIFCGANPHAGGAGRRAGGSPTTSRIINRSGPRRPSGLNPTVDTKQAPGDQRASSGPIPTRGAESRGTPGINEPPPEGKQPGSSTERWRADIERQLNTARANEEAGNIEQALSSWREVSKLQPDNPQIISHIKELEIQVNQLAIEQDIDSGHRLSRTRHPWKAATSYRNALHLMSADDPRVKPVSEALARTERDQRKIGLLYGSAGLILLVFGALAMRPYYQINRFNGAADQLKAHIDAMAGLPPEGLASDISEISTSIDALGTEADHIRGAYGDAAKRDHADLRGTFFAARKTLAATSLTSIDKALQARNPVEADRLITTFEATFGSTEFEPQRLRQDKELLATQKKQFKILDDERKVAPDKLVQAKKHQSENRLGAAIASFRELVGSTNPEVAADAQKAMAVLTPQETAFLAEWNQAIALGGTDLVRCDQALGALATSARLWGREGDQQRLQQEAKTRLKAAEQAYGQLKADATTAQLEAFVAANPTTPQTVQARSRLGVLQSRIQGCDQALALYKQQLDARQYELAWQTGRDLVNGYGALLQPGQMALPLVIESVPSGATVTLSGKVLGHTPLVMTWKPAYGTQPADDGDLTIAAPGWQPTTGTLRDATKNWRLNVGLQRQPLWQVALGKVIGAAYLMPDGTVLVLSGDTLACLDANGRVRWRHGLGTDDVEGGGRARLAHAPAVFPDGRMAFGLPNKDVAIIDGQGNALGKVVTSQEVRGRPLVYSNDVFGSDIRLAVAADAILSGAVGATPLRIPLPDAAISGPLALEKDLDKVLIVGTVSGHLIGIQEQTKKVVWDIDLQATDISQLLHVTDTMIVTVLDGSKVAAIQVRPELASISWSHQLKAPAVGEPALTTTGIVVASGNAVLRYGQDGTMVPSWPLPSAAASAVAALGEVVAVGTQGGTLHVFKGEVSLWTTPCGQPVTAVVVMKDRIIAGLQDGTVLAFGL